MNARQWIVCGIAALAPALAAAQSAQTAKTVNLRAGPARDYPLVVRLGPGTPLAVQGCTDGFGWCDVVAPDGTRGWVYAGNIVSTYQNSNVPVLSYGASIGFPIVVFSLGAYWDSYYRNRPWYGNEHRWSNHRPPPRPIVRPPPGRPGFPGVRPPGGGRPPVMGGGGRPPGPGAGGRPPGDNHGGGRPPNAGGGRPPGDNGGGRPPTAGGGRPPGGDGGRPGGPGPGGGGRPGGPGGERPQNR